MKQWGSYGWIEWRVDQRGASRQNRRARIWQVWGCLEKPGVYSRSKWFLLKSNRKWRTLKRTISWLLLVVRGGIVRGRVDVRRLRVGRGQISGQSAARSAGSSVSQSSWSAIKHALSDRLGCGREAAAAAAAAADRCFTANNQNGGASDRATALADRRMPTDSPTSISVPFSRRPTAEITRKKTPQRLRSQRHNTARRRWCPAKTPPTHPHWCRSKQPSRNASLTVFSGPQILHGICELRKYKHNKSVFSLLRPL